MVAQSNTEKAPGIKSTNAAICEVLSGRFAGLFTCQEHSKHEYDDGHDHSESHRRAGTRLTENIHSSESPKLMKELMKEASCLTTGHRGGSTRCFLRLCMSDHAFRPAAGTRSIGRRCSPASRIQHQHRLHKGCSLDSPSR